MWGPLAKPWANRPVWPVSLRERSGICACPVRVSRRRLRGHVTSARLGRWFPGRAILGGQEGLIQRACRVLGEGDENTRQHACSVVLLRTGDKVALHACTMRPVDGKAVPHMGVDRLADKNILSARRETGPDGRPCHRIGGPIARSSNTAKGTLFHPAPCEAGLPWAGP